MSPCFPRFADRFESQPKSAALMLSCGLAFLTPLFLGVYWLIYAADTDVAIRFLRPLAIAVALLLALVWNKLAITWAELRLAGIMAVMCAVLLVPSLAATDPYRALADWLKLVILCVIGLLFSRALRDNATAEAFGRALIIGSTLPAVLIVYTYVKYMGFTIPTYESARVLKAVAIHANVPLNSIAFSCVFAYICGMCLVRRSRILWWLGAVLFVVSSALTGSRAPVAILAATGFVLLLLNGAVSRNPIKRLFTWLSVIALVAAIAWGTQVITFAQMSSATEGRWDFWSVAWQKFTERPLVGYGFDSWRDDLVSRLPGEYRLTSYDAINLAGGYHNEYMTLLAEQGIVGFLPVIALFIFLWRCSWKLAFQPSVTWRNGQWALFGCIFLLLRAAVEAPGLFGYGQEPADYLAFIFVAIVASRFSIEEDYVKSAQALEQSKRYQGYASERAAAFA